MNIKQLTQSVKDQGFPEREYAIFGSAAMAVRGIREAPNIDVIVTDLLWEELLKKNTPDSEGFIRLPGSVKVSNWWFAPTRKPLLQLIKEAEIIDSLPFVHIEEVLDYKKGLNRDKDKRDAELIEEYLSNDTPVNLGYDTYKNYLDVFTEKIENSLGDKILSLVLFGSSCRGQAKGNSDLDMFIIYDHEKTTRKEINEAVISICVGMRKSDEYKKLMNRKIYPEVHPFFIDKESVKNELLYVSLDATDHGIVLKGEQAVENIKKLIKKKGGKRISLPNGKWCWIFNMGDKKRAKLLFDAAVECKIHAEISFDRKAWNMAIRRAQESVELELTGMMALLGTHYPKEHDQAPMLLRRMGVKGIKISEDIRTKIEQISADLARKRGPALHQEQGYDKETAQDAIEKMNFVLDKMRKYEELLK